MESAREVFVPQRRLPGDRVPVDGMSGNADASIRARIVSSHQPARDAGCQP